MSGAQAHVLRRLGLGAAALASTLVAHGAATGHAHVVPAAPALWGWLLLAAAFVGRRRAPWRERPVPVIFAMLLAFQAALHVGMGLAPWAFGLEVHHAQALVTPGAVLAHLIAAAVLTVLLARLERLLTAAQRVVETVRSVLAPAPARGGAPSYLLRVAVAAAPASPPRRPASARGPPLPSV